MAEEKSNQPPTPPSPNENPGLRVRVPVVHARFAVGEQVEVKGIKFYVWQVDRSCNTIALVEWTTAMACKNRQRIEKKKSILYKPEKP